MQLQWKNNSGEKYSRLTNEKRKRKISVTKHRTWYSSSEINLWEWTRRTSSSNGSNASSTRALGLAVSPLRGRKKLENWSRLCSTNTELTLTSLQKSLESNKNDPWMK